MSYECYCDFDGPEFCSVSIVKAKKSHRCIECGTEIKPADKYEKTVGKWDGDFDTYKTCCHCLAVKQYVLAHVPCFCWVYGDMLSEARECIRSIRHEVPGMGFEFGRLFVAAMPKLVRGDSK